MVPSKILNSVLVFLYSISSTYLYELTYDVWDKFLIRFHMKSLRSCSYFKTTNLISQALPQDIATVT